MSKNEMEQILFTRLNVYDKNSRVATQLSSTLPIGPILMEYLNNCASVLKLGGPSPAQRNSVYNHHILIRFRNEFTYESGEAELTEALKCWYEEHCGAIEMYRPLAITHHSGTSPSHILQPSPDSPRAQIGNLTLLRDLAIHFGDTSVSAEYGLQIHRLRNLLGQRGHY